MTDEIKNIRQMEDQVQKAQSIIKEWEKKKNDAEFKEQLDLMIWHLENAKNIGEKLLKERPNYVKQ